MSVYIPALLGFLLLAFWFLRRRRSSPYRRAWLLVYTGAEFSVYPVSQVQEGVVAADGVIYPAGVLAALTANSIHFRSMLGSAPLYFLPIEAVELANHRALERARCSVMVRALFFGGGDILHYLTIAALVVPLIVSVLMYGQVSGLQSTLARIEAGVTRLVTPNE
jgi:hypothetical protein